MVFHWSLSNCKSRQVSRTPLSILADLYYYYYYSLYVFSSQRWLMVFHWSLSDSKSAQVACTLLSILADLNNAEFGWSQLVLYFPTLYHFTKPLGIIPSALIMIGITVTFIFHSFFLVLWQGLNICLSFHFLIFSLCGQPERQIAQFGRLSSFFFFFFVNSH